MPSNKAAVSAAALCVLAGAAQALADLTFSPYCNNNWYQECSFSPACPGGGYPTYNNWQQSACSGGLPTPGAGDIAHLGGNSLTINGAIAVAGMDETAAASIVWTAGDITISAPFQNVGDFTWTPGNVNLSATINNSGSLHDINGYSRAFQNATINNSGTLEWQSTLWSAGSGTNQINSSGTVLKTTGGAATIGVAINNTGGTWDVQAGSVNLNNITVQSAPAVSYLVESGSSLAFNGVGLSGTFNLANGGSAVFNTWSLTGDTVLNATGNGLTWTGGDFSGGAHTLTNQGILGFNAGNVNLSGAILNSGHLTDYNGYNRAFQNATITNAAAGTVEWQSTSWNPGAGGSFTTAGTVLKTTGGAANLSVGINATGGHWDLQGGQTNLNSTTVQSGNSVSYTLAPGTGLTFNNDILSGTFAVSNGGSVNLNTFVLGANTTFNVTGNEIVWSSGACDTGAFTLTNQGLMGINAGNVAFAGAIVNNGMLTDHNGYSRSFYDSSITNAPGGTVNWESTNWNPASGHSGTFTNNGTLNKVTGGAADIYVAFVSNGAVHVSGGALNLRAAVQSTPAATYDVTTNLNFIGATLAGTFNGTNTGSIAIPGGWTLAGDTTLNIGGNGVVWTGGDLDTGGYTLTNRGPLTMTPGNVGFWGAINNLGLITDVNGYNRAFHNSSITNAPGATVEWQSATWNPGSGESGLFTNNGTVTKTTGGAANLSVTFVNNGEVNLQAGAANMNGNSVQSGPASSWTVDGGALVFNGARLSGTFAGNNNGVVAANGWALEGDATINFAGNGFLWASGDLDTTVGGSHRLTNVAGMAINASNVNFTGTIRNQGTLSDSNGYNRAFHDAVLDNPGTIEWGSLSWSVGSGQTGTLNNSGTVHKNAGGAYVGVAVNNSGLMDLLGGTTNFAGGFTQTAGLTRLDGGSINGGTITLLGGRFDGNGTAAATVNNTSGTVAPGASVGAITIAGPYTQAGTGNIEIELAGTTPGTTFDHLQVNGAAAVGGSVTVRFAPGYTPPLGTTYRFLDSTGTLSGAFQIVHAIGAPLGVGVQVTYDAHGATLVLVHECGSTDFNCDGDVGTDADITAFFQCLAGSCPPPPCTSTADFNADGDLGTDADIESFFRVLSGGSC